MWCAVNFENKIEMLNVKIANPHWVVNLLSWHQREKLNLIVRMVCPDSSWSWIRYKQRRNLNAISPQKLTADCFLKPSLKAFILPLFQGSGYSFCTFRRQLSFCGIHNFAIKIQRTTQKRFFRRTQLRIPLLIPRMKLCYFLSRFMFESTQHNN